LTEDEFVAAVFAMFPGTVELDEGGEPAALEQLELEDAA
jgi:hypothetical protein